MTASPAALKGINYFPQGYAGVMWPGASPWTGSSFTTVPAAWAADLATLVSYGFNTARIFLQVSAYNASDATGSFNDPTPLSTQLSRLTNFLAAAVTAGIKLHVTLFDAYGSYGDIAGAQTWVAAILGVLNANTAAVACVELQNETPWSSTTAYAGSFDGGWTGSQVGVTVAAAATQWAQVIMPYMRGLTSLPITASATDSATASPVNLPAALTILTGSSAPDWIEWHAYPWNVGMLAGVISAAKAICGSMALRIGETGCPVVPSGNQSQAQANQAADDWIKTARWACRSLGLACPEPVPWAMYDNGGGTNYGLWDESGNTRAAALSYLRLPPGSTNVRAPGLNLSFTAPIADANSQSVPQSWYLYKGNGGAQPITAATSGDVVTLTSTSYEPTGTDNPPALAAIYCGEPISAGTVLGFRVNLAGTAQGVYLAIDWYSASGGYLSSTISSTVNLTSTPQTVTVSGTAPATTNYAIAYISYNYGTTTGGTMVVSPTVTQRGVFAGPSGRVRFPLP